MKKKLELNLINWRCFNQQKFAIPWESQIISDQNGSGKTTLLSAIYSLFTKKPWPETKLKDSIKNGAEYYGIVSGQNDWFLNGKFNPSGRLSNKFSKPDEVKLPFSDSKEKLSLNDIKILTYLPTDNFWFFQSRKKRLDILDQLLIQIGDESFYKQLRNLDKLVKSKQRLIKKTIEEERPADEALVQSLNTEIFKTSKEIWETRKTFLEFLNKKLKEFNNWINCPLKNWQVRWEISDFDAGKKTELFSPDKGSAPEGRGVFGGVPNWQKLWQKELIIGKVMYGAQRDEFKIISDHHEVQNVLSRGEMRSLVLFIKDLARQKIDQKTIWLLDDIFNELDEEREQKIFKQILKKTDLFIATSTKDIDLNVPCYNLEKLKI